MSLVICLGLSLNTVEVGFTNIVETAQLDRLSGRKEAIVALPAFWTCFSEDFCPAGSWEGTPWMGCSVFGPWEAQWRGCAAQSAAVNVSAAGFRLCEMRPISNYSSIK